MHTRQIIALSLLFACTAGCDNPDTPAAGEPATSAPVPKATSATATPPIPDADVARRFDCQAHTTVVVLQDGSAQVTLPGGDRHALAAIAGSDPQAYSGETLNFTIYPDATHPTDAGAGSGARPGRMGVAYLAQQDGARELACHQTQ